MDILWIKFWILYNTFARSLPSSPKLEKISSHIIYIYMVYGWCMAGVWLVYGRCMAGVWPVYGRCMAGVWLVLYGWCMAGVWLVYGCIIVVTKQSDGKIIYFQIESQSAGAQQAGMVGIHQAALMD